jgi:hypothetical protein
MDKTKAFGIAIAVALLFGIGFIAYTQFFATGGTPGGGNFQVNVEAYLREDLGANAIWNGHEVDIYRDGGATFVETVTSTSAGLLDFANMYWVGEVITAQVRTDAPASTGDEGPYIMAAVDISIPASAEAGDTVSLGIIWARQDTATAPTMTVTNQTGGTIDDTTEHFVCPTDTELRILLHTITSGEGWGIQDEVIDLRTGYKYIGGIVVFKTSSAQPISNYKWHVSGGSEEYYIIQPGRFADDPNIVDDGTLFCKFTFSGTMTADASINFYAYDQEKYEDMMNAQFGNHDISPVTTVASKIY